MFDQLTKDCTKELVDEYRFRARVLSNIIRGKSSGPEFEGGQHDNFVEDVNKIHEKVRLRKMRRDLPLVNEVDGVKYTQFAREESERTELGDQIVEVRARLSTIAELGGDKGNLFADLTDEFWKLSVQLSEEWAQEEVSK